LKHSKIDLLKMDIEGAEYSVLKDMESVNIRPKQLLIEFHHRFPNVGIGETKKAIRIVKEWDMDYFRFQALEKNIALSSKMANKRMHSDNKKRRSFLALLFVAGDAKRWAMNT